MIEALVLDYIHEMQVTKETCRHRYGRGIYIESESLLVERNLPKWASDPIPDLKYRVFAGDEAGHIYRRHLVDLDSAISQNPKKIVVPDSFVEWARALYRVQEPKPEVSDLISEVLEPISLNWPNDPLIITHSESDKKLAKYLS